MPDQKKEKEAPALSTSHSWSVTLKTQDGNLRVETSASEYDTLDFIDVADGEALLISLTFDEFEALYNKVKERREVFSKLEEHKA
jgi:hypothetical protein